MIIGSVSNRVTQLPTAKIATPNAIALGCDR